MNKQNNSKISKDLLGSVQKAIGFFLGIFLLLYVIPTIFLHNSDSEVIKEYMIKFPSTTMTIIMAVIACIIGIIAIVIIQQKKKNCKDTIHPTPESEVSDKTVKVLNNYFIGFKFWRILLVVIIILVAIFLLLFTL